MLFTGDVEISSAPLHLKPKVTPLSPCFCGTINPLSMISTRFGCFNLPFILLGYRRLMGGFEIAIIRLYMRLREDGFLILSHPLKTNDNVKLRAVGVNVGGGLLFV